MDSIDKLARIKAAANPPKAMNAEAWEVLVEREVPRLGADFLNKKADLMNRGATEADAEAQAFGYIALLAARRLNEALKA